MKKRLIRLILLFLCFSPLFTGAYSSAQEQSRTSQGEGGWRKFFGFGRSKEREKIAREESLQKEGVVDLIDTPTVRLLQYGDFRFNFRFYRDGGLLNHLAFGVFKRLNLGLSWDVEKFLGVEDPSPNVPTLNLKIKAYDGGRILPALVIGYDGQGRFFNKSADRYLENERGFYMAAGSTLGLRDLEGRAGVYIAKYNDGAGNRVGAFGFFGLSYFLEDKILLMVEYDNVKDAPLNRFNAGFRIFPFPSLGIDFAVRNLFQPFDRERIVRINYVESF